MQITLNGLTQKDKILLASKVCDNRFIIHNPFKQQLYYLADTSEELLYGGMAGGGKSDCLLMSALMYCDYLPTDSDKVTYDALILRRTLDDLEMPNAILDRAKQWLLPFENEGLLYYKDLKKKFTFYNGATLTFRYLAHNNDLMKYQGAELQFIGFDELTQFPQNQYLYLHSRLRKTEDNPIPLRMRGATNPGGIGHDWVKNRFIKKDSPCKYIPSAYTDNPYLNHEEYGQQLDKLDPLTRQQLKKGDWDATMMEGLLCNRTDLNNNLISYESFKDWIISYSAIGIDSASTGDDKFAMALLVYFTNGKVVLVDLDVDITPSPEQTLINFIERNQHWRPSVVNFEREAGSNSHYALQYWTNTLMDLSVDFGFYVMDTPAVATGNKFQRARPHSQLVRSGQLLFNRDIKGRYIDGELYNPLNALFNQYVYIHPDLSIMKQYSSPDELDAVGYAFAELQKVVNF